MIMIEDLTDYQPVCMTTADKLMPGAIIDGPGGMYRITNNLRFRDRGRCILHVEPVDPEMFNPMRTSEVWMQKEYFVYIKKN